MGSPRVISDPEDPAVASYRGSDVRSSVAAGRFVAETEIVVRRLLESPLEVESVLLTPGRLDQLRESLSDAGRGRLAAVEVLVAPRKLLTEIVGFERHRGVAALATRPPPRDLEAAVTGRDVLTVLIAEGIADPQNIGTILRAARAFAVDLVLLGPRCGDPWSRRASRAAMGNNMAMRETIACVDDLAATIAGLRSQLPELAIAAATVGPAAQPLALWRRPRKLALVVGNEGAGISDALLQLADHELTIPMAAGVDSLNVGAATAVLLYAAGGLVLPQEI